MPTPPELDLQLAARVARERYSAEISVVYSEEGELMVLGGEEGRGRRTLELGKMVDHLAGRHDWIEALPGDDHVARMRVQGLNSLDGRLDQVIQEIGMGRSILEG